MDVMIELFLCTDEGEEPEEADKLRLYEHEFLGVVPNMWSDELLEEENEDRGDSGSS